MPGSEFLGKRVPGSEFLGKRVPGSEFLGKRSHTMPLTQDEEEELYHVMENLTNQVFQDVFMEWFRGHLSYVKYLKLCPY